MNIDQYTVLRNFNKLNRLLIFLEHTLYLNVLFFDHSMSLKKSKNILLNSKMMKLFGFYTIFELIKLSYYFAVEKIL